MFGEFMTRRSLLRTAAVMGAATGLAACGGGATQAPAATTAPAAATAVSGAATTAPEATAPAAATSNVTLEVWNTNWGETYNAPMSKLGEDYTAATGVKVNWSFNDQWQEKLLTAVAANIPPDCCYTNYVGLPTLAFQQVLLPLDDYFAQSSIQGADFIKAMYDACVYEGKTYAIPGGADFLVIHYNKQVYRDAGLDPEQPPVTLADWVAHSEKITQVDSAGNFTRMGMNPTDPGLVYDGFLYGGDFYDANAKKVTCNQGGVVEALDWITEQSKKWPAEKVAAFNASQPGYGQPNSGFATGKLAYLFTGFWSAEALDQYAPDLDYGICFLPTLKGTPEDRKNYVIQGWDYSIPKGAKSADEAWKFLKYGFYDNAAKLGVTTINGNCVLAQMDEFNKGVEAWLGADNRMTPYFHIFTETGAAGEKYWPVMPVASRYYDEVIRAQDFASRGEMTAQAALDEAARVTQEELDKAFQGA